MNEITPKIIGDYDAYLQILCRMPGTLQSELQEWEKVAGGEYIFKEDEKEFLSQVPDFFSEEEKLAIYYQKFIKRVSPLTGKLSKEQISVIEYLQELSKRVNFRGYNGFRSLRNKILTLLYEEFCDSRIKKLATINRDVATSTKGLKAKYSSCLQDYATEVMGAFFCVEKIVMRKAVSDAVLRKINLGLIRRLKDIEQLMNIRMEAVKKGSEQYKAIEGRIKSLQHIFNRLITCLTQRRKLFPLLLIPFNHKLSLDFSRYTVLSYRETLDISKIYFLSIECMQSQIAKDNVELRKTMKSDPLIKKIKGELDFIETRVSGMKAASQSILEQFLDESDFVKFQNAMEDGSVHHGAVQERVRVILKYISSREKLFQDLGTVYNTGRKSFEEFIRKIKDLPTNVKIHGELLKDHFESHAHQVIQALNMAFNTTLSFSKTYWNKIQADCERNYSILRPYSAHLSTQCIRYRHVYYTEGMNLLYLFRQRNEQLFNKYNKELDSALGNLICTFYFLNKILDYFFSRENFVPCYQEEDVKTLSFFRTWGEYTHKILEEVSILKGVSRQCAIPNLQLIDEFERLLGIFEKERIEVYVVGKALEFLNTSVGNNPEIRTSEETFLSKILDNIYFGAHYFLDTGPVSKYVIEGGLTEGNPIFEVLVACHREFIHTLRNWEEEIETKYAPGRRQGSSKKLCYEYIAALLKFRKKFRSLNPIGVLTFFGFKIDSGGLKDGTMSFYEAYETYNQLIDRHFYLPILPILQMWKEERWFAPAPRGIVRIGKEAKEKQSAVNSVPIVDGQEEGVPKLRAVVAEPTIQQPQRCLYDVLEVAQSALRRHIRGESDAGKVARDLIVHCYIPRLQGMVSKIQIDSCLAHANAIIHTKALILERALRWIFLQNCTKDLEDKFRDNSFHDLKRIYLRLREFIPDAVTKLSGDDQKQLEDLRYVTDKTSRYPYRAFGRVADTINHFNFLGCLRRNLVNRSKLSIEEMEYCEKQLGEDRETWQIAIDREIKRQLSELHLDTRNILRIAGQLLGIDLSDVMSGLVVEDNTSSVVASNPDASMRDRLRKTLEASKQSLHTAFQQLTHDQNQVEQQSPTEERVSLRTRTEIIIQSVENMHIYLNIVEELLFKNNVLNSCYADANELLKFSSLFVERAVMIALAQYAFHQKEHPNEHPLLVIAPNETRPLMFSHHFETLFKNLAVIFPNEDLSDAEKQWIVELKDMVSQIDRYPIGLNGTVVELLENRIKVLNELFLLCTRSGGVAGMVSSEQNKLFNQFLGKEVWEKHESNSVLPLVEERIFSCMNQEVYSRVHIGLALGTKILNLILNRVGSR